MSGPAPPPPWLEYLDHTADLGIVVTAAELPQLFARAAWGMFSVVADLARFQPSESFRVEMEAPDLPALLVRWLSELNYLHLTRHVVWARFDVLQVDATRVVSEVWGERLRPGPSVVRTEIKAVTYHGLEVEQRGGQWRARIIFDL